MHMLIKAGLTCMYQIMKFFTSIVLELNMFLKNLKNLKMCGYFYIGFIDFMLANKTLTEFNSLFSPYDFD